MSHVRSPPLRLPRLCSRYNAQCAAQPAPCQQPGRNPKLNAFPHMAISSARCAAVRCRQLSIRRRPVAAADLRPARAALQGLAAIKTAACHKA